MPRIGRKIQTTARVDEELKEFYNTLPWPLRTKIIGPTIRSYLNMQRAVGGPMERSGYDTAQICLSGHVVTKSFHDFPEFRSDFCTQCGAATITACHECCTEIRGFHRETLSINYDRPSFCYGCGAAYPWTASALEALRELAQEASNLPESERDILARSFDDLVRDTPKTEIAVLRLKRLLPHIGQELAGSMRTILINIATDAVKRNLGL